MFARHDIRNNLDLARDYPYKVTVPPAEEPVTVAEAKAQVNWPSNNGSLDANFTGWIVTARIEAEKISRLDFVERTYETKRDSFGGAPRPQSWPFIVTNNGIFEIRKSPFISAEEIKYLNDSDVETVVTASDYYVVETEAYDQIHNTPNTSWPTDINLKLGSVTITFKAGFGAAADVPGDIKQAILQIVASIFANRGDCDPSTSDCDVQIPAQARRTLLLRRIENL